jgi:hypothetical protein
MTSPASAPTLETIDMREQLAQLTLEVERLREIIDIYIKPNEYIFSEDEDVKTEARRAVSKKAERDRNAIENISYIMADVEDLKSAVDVLAHKRKPGEVTQKRLDRTDSLLVARRNMPIPFSEMGRLQEFKPKYRDQDMTKLGHLYERFPQKYIVRASKLGGKTVLLTKEYYNHLTRGGALAC